MSLQNLCQLWKMIIQTLVYETGWIDLPRPLPHPPLHPKHHCTIVFFSQHITKFTLSLIKKMYKKKIILNIGTQQHLFKFSQNLNKSIYLDHFHAYIIQYLESAPSRAVCKALLKIAVCSKYKLT